MKGVVVDIKGSYAVALGKNGSFVRIKYRKGMETGSEIEMPAAGIIRLNTYARAASVAAVFIVTLGLSYGVYSYSTPYSYVNVDINPSVELTANRYDRIIASRGLNEDGSRLLKDGVLKNKKLDDGIKDVLESAMKEGYLNKDNANSVMITVTGKDERKSEELEKEVQDAAAVKLENSGVNTELLVEKTAVERRDEAREFGISPGKLNLIEKLKETRPEVKVEDYKDASVKDIMKSIKEDKKEETTGKDTGKQKEDKEDKTGKAAASQDRGKGRGAVSDRNKADGTGNGKEKADTKSGESTGKGENKSWKDKEDKEDKQIRDDREAKEDGDNKEGKGNGKAADEDQGRTKKD